MRQLNINKQNGTVHITFSCELEQIKSKLYIDNNKSIKKFERLLNKVKKFSKFKKLSLYYEQIDYYDNMTDVYETPYIYFEKGKRKRKPTVSNVEYGSIPKNWNEVFKLELENPKTIKPIEVFLNHFNIKLKNKQIKEVRTAMKGLSSFNCEF